MSISVVKSVPSEYALNAVVYARYSSDKQTENSIDGQLRACNQFAAQHGYTILHEYIDRAVSGTTDNRPQFQQMIADAKRQRFAFVIVYRFDRFSRNRYDSAIYKKELSKYGVRVISTAEHVGDGDEGIILESIYEAMDEAYSRRLSRITQRGMRETAIKGLWTGGNVPLGYKVENQRLVIDDREATIVRYLFKQYADGKTKTQIAKALNEKGYTTKKKKAFTASNLSAILTNRMYIGDYHFQDIERTCPAIISEHLFERVGAALDANRKIMGRKTDGTIFELSGKLYCGYCGAAMTGDSGTSQSGDVHYYYTCSTRKKKHACKKKSEKKDFIEWYICEQTVLNVLNDENIPKIAERVVTLSEDEACKDEIEKLEKQIADINKELDDCADALIRSTAPAIVKRINVRVELLEKQLNDAEVQLAQKQLVAEQRLTVADVERYLRSFTKGDLLDEDFRHHIIHTFINSVYLYDDKIVMYFNIKDMSQVSYVDMINDLDLDLDELKECSDSAQQGEPN